MNLGHIIRGLNPPTLTKNMLINTNIIKTCVYCSVYQESKFYRHTISMHGQGIRNIPLANIFKERKSYYVTRTGYNSQSCCSW